MKPLLLSFSALLLSFCSFGQNPYLAIKADSVVIYDYNSKYKTVKPQHEGDSTQTVDISRPDMPIVKDGILSNTILRSAKLDKNTASKFTSMLGDTNSFGASEAACFQPHLGIVYWKNGQPKAFISICMDCNVLEPNMPLPAKSMYTKGPETNGVPYIPRPGMSLLLRKYILRLLVKYNFSHQTIYNSPFDK